MKPRFPAFPRGLHDDTSGVTIVEFGLIAPALLLSVMGIFDMGYNIYTQALLRGAIQKAARDSTIEGASSSESGIDAHVAAAVRSIVPGATVRFGRRSYANFTDVARPEDFTDIDADGECDHGEPFEDANGNGAWDADRGAVGMGGARDAVLYDVTVTYNRAFPLSGLIGLPNTVSTVGTSVLRNQPYGAQQSVARAGNCA